MDHCHHDCKHEVVKYCSKCGKVYCDKCGREWEDKCTLNHYPYYQWTYTTPTVTYPMYDSKTTIISNPTICTH
jgi:hypothetical protein